MLKIATIERANILLSCKLLLITAIASLTFTFVGPVQFMMLEYLKTQNYVNVKGQNGTLLPNTHRTINGIEVPIVIVGDPTYPLLPWLMKPFADNGRLTPDARTFNYWLSRA